MEGMSEDSDGVYFPAETDGTQSAHLHTECRELLHQTSQNSSWEVYVNIQQNIQKQTQHAVKQECYLSHTGERVVFNKDKLRRAAAQTELITEKWVDEKAPNKYLRTFVDTHIHVIEGDFLDLAAIISSKMKSAKIHDTPCVIMSVHPNKPFDHFLNEGLEYSDGVEEEAYRRTTLVNNSKDCNKYVTRQREWHYNIPEFGGVFAPAVKIFRSGEKNGYYYYHAKDKAVVNPVCSFVLITPIKQPKHDVIRNGEFPEYDRNRLACYKKILNLPKKHVEKIEKKYEIALNIAYLQQHRCVIFAGPCECFKSPSWHVGHILKEKIRRDFKHKFEEIIFCCVENYNAAFRPKTQPLRYVLEQANPIPYPYMQNRGMKCTYQHPTEAEVRKYVHQVVKFEPTMEVSPDLEGRAWGGRKKEEDGKSSGERQPQGNSKEIDKLAVLNMEIDEMILQKKKLVEADKKEREESRKLYKQVTRVLTSRKGINDMVKRFNKNKRYTSFWEPPKKPPNNGQIKQGRKEY